ncbi:putative protein without homology [Propionibacterium freudenreichii subsp. shermanii]|nr:putative protein without homology [Propionibacterium freudenreichii subsp. shermanii]
MAQRGENRGRGFLASQRLGNSLCRGIKVNAAVGGRNKYRCGHRLRLRRPCCDCPRSSQTRVTGDVPAAYACRRAGWCFVTPGAVGQGALAGWTRPRSAGTHRSPHGRFQWRSSAIRRITVQFFALGRIAL